MSEISHISGVELHRRLEQRGLSWEEAELLVLRREWPGVCRTIEEFFSYDHKLQP